MKDRAHVELPSLFMIRPVLSFGLLVSCRRYFRSHFTFIVVVW